MCIWCPWGIYAAALQYQKHRPLLRSVPRRLVVSAGSATGPAPGLLQVPTVKVQLSCEPRDAVHWKIKGVHLYTSCNTACHFCSGRKAKRDRNYTVTGCYYCFEKTAFSLKNTLSGKMLFSPRKARFLRILTLHSFAVSECPEKARNATISPKPP